MCEKIVKSKTAHIMWEVYLGILYIPQISKSNGEDEEDAYSSLMVIDMADAMTILRSLWDLLLHLHYKATRAKEEERRLKKIGGATTKSFSL